MQETSERKLSTWKRPLKGWRWWAAWTLLIAVVAAVSGIVLHLTTEKSVDAPAAWPWLLAVGIALTAAILIGLLAHGLSSWRNFKRLLLGLACLAGLMVVFYAEENIRGRLAWRQFKAQWEAKGEKFDFAAFIPPSVPDGQNFAMTPVVASTYGQILDRHGRKISPRNTNVVNRLRMPLDAGDGGFTNGVGDWQKAISINLEPWQRYYRKLSLTTNLFPVAPQPQTPAADVLLALSKYDSTLEELRRAAALPVSRFPLNYESEETFAILLPHLAPMRECAQVLRLRALAALEAGHSEMALADISLALRLTETIRSEPFLISHLVRMAMLQAAEQAVWEGLARHRWTDAQLCELERQLAGFDFVADYRAAMRAENAGQVATTEFLRRYPGQWRTIEGYDENDPNCFSDLVAYGIPSGWLYQNELRGSKYILETLLPIGDLSRQTISPTLAKQADKSFQTMRFTPYTMLCKLLLPALAKRVSRFALAQATVNLSRTAGALERYRLAQGKYPETLDALAPQFIAKVPHDPIGGLPFHYRARGGGQFILYSVGWNEKDDGGIVSLTKMGRVDVDNGDWVWRYPDLPNP